MVSTVINIEEFENENLAQTSFFQRYNENKSNIVSTKLYKNYIIQKVNFSYFINLNKEFNQDISSSLLENYIFSENSIKIE